MKMPINASTLHGHKATLLFYNRAERTYVGEVHTPYGRDRVTWDEDGMCAEDFAYSVSLDPKRSFNTRFLALPQLTQGEIWIAWSAAQDAYAIQLFEDAEKNPNMIPKYIARAFMLLMFLIALGTMLKG